MKKNILCFAGVAVAAYLTIHGRTEMAKRLGLARNVLRGRPTIAFAKFTAPLVVTDANGLMVVDCDISGVQPDTGEWSPVDKWPAA